MQWEGYWYAVLNLQENSYAQIPHNSESIGCEEQA